jgi:hypothetical protein
MIQAVYDKFNPFRTPEWRSDRAMTLAGNQPRRLRAARHDDKYVREYAKFLARYLPAAEANDEEAKMQLFAKNPGLYYAQEIHFQEDYEWRAIVQARLLTDASFEQIAKGIGTMPMAIYWYERLFFDVRDRLDCHDWIVKTVLGTVIDRSANREGTVTEHQRNMTYKLFGYFGGQLVLDTIVSGFNRGTLPSRVNEVANWFDVTVKNLIRSRAAAAARVFEVNKFNVMQLFELQLGVITSDLQAKSQQSGPQSPLTKNVAALLEMSPWALAKDYAAPRTDEQKRYALTAIEPTLEEEFSLAYGVVPKSLEAREASREQLLLTAGDVT